MQLQVHSGVSETNSTYLYFTSAYSLERMSIRFIHRHPRLQNFYRARIQRISMSLSDASLNERYLTSYEMVSYLDSSVL